MAREGNESGTFRSATAAGAENLSKDEAHLDDPAVRKVGLERVVAQLNAICKTATLKFALDVGALVVRHFYAGNVAIWRNRDRTKDTSLRKLARHPHLPMSPSALYRCVAIYELCERLQLTTWKHISSGHMRLVLPLAPDQQERLLSTAEAERWSVRQLDARVEAEMQSDPSMRSNRGGLSRGSRLRKMMRPLKQFVAVASESLEPSDSETIESDLSPDNMRDAVRLLHSAVEACNAVENRLRASHPAEPMVDHHLKTASKQ
jgi:hypothetical protein